MESDKIISFERNLKLACNKIQAIKNTLGDEFFNSESYRQPYEWERFVPTSFERYRGWNNRKGKRMIRGTRRNLHRILSVLTKQARVSGDLDKMNQALDVHHQAHLILSKITP